MIYGRIKTFIAKAETYKKGGGKTPQQIKQLQAEALSLSKQISLGALKDADKIIEKLTALVEIRNQAISNFDAIATEYYAILENLLKYGTGYRTKSVHELSEIMAGCYKKYDEYLEQTKHELTRPLVAYKKAFGVQLQHGIKLGSYYTKNKGKTDLIPAHVAATLKKPDGMETN